MAKSKLSTSAAKKRPAARHPQSHKSGSASATHGKAAKKVAEKPNVGYTIHDQHRKLHDAFSASASGDIGTENTDRTKISAGLSEWLAKLDQFAIAHPGQPVSAYAREIIPPSIQAIEQADALRKRVPVLPDKAPALWKRDRNEDDTPVSFTMRHYGKYMDAEVGITQGNIRKLDPALYIALSNYRRHHAAEFPDEFVLPTARERNDLWVNRMKEAETTGQSITPYAPQDTKAAARLVAAAHRRAHNSSRR